MKTSKLFAITTILVLYSIVTCQAHEGHGHEDPLSPGHYIFNPEHALPLALTLVVVLVGGWYIYRTVSRAREK